MQLSLSIQVPLAAWAMAIEHETDARAIGFFGPSGCGKTTLLEVIAGIRRLPGLTGSIRFGGETWMDSARKVWVPPQRRGIGYVPQDHLLFPHWNVEKNLRAGQHRAQEGGEGFEEHFRSVTAALELESMLARPVTALSGGERQRVALGRALCSRPRLLLLDEPLASLDGKLRYRILPFLQRVRERFALPLVLVSHHPADLQAVCDEVVALAQGKVIARGRPDDVLLRPDIYSGVDQDGGYETILPAWIVGHEHGLTRLSLAPPVAARGEALTDIVPTVRVRRLDQAAGVRVMLRLHSSEVLVANRPVEGLSARNCLSARIEKLEALSDKVLLVAKVSGVRERLAAQLTRDSVDELGLTVGQTTYLFIKSNAIEVCG